MTEFTKEQGGVGAYCPFCGDERNLVEIGVPFDDGICHVECARCGAHGPVESAEDRAISAWNLRAGGPAERPALNAKEFSREELETLAGLSAFESNPVVRLAQVAAFALAQMERAEKVEKRVAELSPCLAVCDVALDDILRRIDQLDDLLRRIDRLDEKADAASWQKQAEDRLDLLLKIAAERDRFRVELGEAEEAIRGLAWWFADSDGNLPPDTMPCSDPDCLACRALFGSPAVLRALERGGRG